jgi:hypothetical protein
MHTRFLTHGIPIYIYISIHLDSRCAVASTITSNHSLAPRRLSLSCCRTLRYLFPIRQQLQPYMHVIRHLLPMYMCSIHAHIGTLTFLLPSLYSSIDHPPTFSSTFSFSNSAFLYLSLFSTPHIGCDRDVMPFI